MDSSFASIATTPVFAWTHLLGSEWVFAKVVHCTDFNNIMLAAVVGGGPNLFNARLIGYKDLFSFVSPTPVSKYTGDQEARRCALTQARLVELLEDQLVLVRVGSGNVGDPLQVQLKLANDVDPVLVVDQLQAEGYAQRPCAQ